MPFDLNIPKPNGSSLQISITVGQCIFILGANGTGKSSLMLNLYNLHNQNARRISAHRQTWFLNNEITISPAEKRKTEEAIRHVDKSMESRWLDNYAHQRPTIALYDLIDAENVRARAITCAVDGGDIELAKTLSKEDAPIKIINELLRLSNIPIQISVRKNEEVVATKSGSEPYSVAQLSDGERNALLIAASVLTAPAGTLLLIDEPERHLHRSIISPLLSILFSKRPDCAFVVSTHDVMLPLDNPMAQVMLVRTCTYNGTSVTSWEADLIPSESMIDDTLKKDILGSRRTVIFIEGDERSLDKPLYSLLFPDVTVIAKRSCRDVEHAVTGIRAANDLHWLHAFGIVDNDRRPPEDIARLKDKGVYAVSVYSVESLYYHPEIQRKLADRHATVTGEDPLAHFQAAEEAALAALSPHVKRLSERATERTLRDELDKHWPKQCEISDGNPINITIDVAATVNEEVFGFETALVQRNLEKIIAKYPVRETPMLNEVARKLGFQSREQYENAVRKLLMDDGNVLNFLRSQFGTLCMDLTQI